MFKINVNPEFDLSNHATISAIKDARWVDGAEFAMKADLINLKSDKKKLDTISYEKVATNLNS